MPTRKPKARQKERAWACITPKGKVVLSSIATTEQGAITGLFWTAAEFNHAIEQGYRFARVTITEEK